MNESVHRPIAKGKAARCLMPGRWFSPLSCHRLSIWPRTRHFFPGRTVKWGLSGGWWRLRHHNSWFHINVIDQWGYQNLAFGFLRMPLIHTPRPALLCSHGRCADHKNYNSSRNMKSGRLNWMKTPCCKCHSYYCNVHDVGTNSSMFIQGPHSNGLLCHGPGSMYGLGRYNLWFPGKSAPTYCRVKPAHAGSYWKGLKYHWCPTDNNEAVFFQLPPNGHLDYHLEHWAASLLAVSVNRDVKSYPRACQWSSSAQGRTLTFCSRQSWSWQMTNCGWSCHFIVHSICIKRLCSPGFSA